MARIKYSGLVDEINGSIGGTTFQRNRYGFTIKRKGAPTKGRTPVQASRRLDVYRVTQDWLGLSGANKDNWNTYATTFPRPTRLNPNSFLNGFNYFEAYNLLRRLHQPSSLPNPSGAQQSFSFGGQEIDGAGGGLTWESAISVSGGNWIFLAFMSRPIRESQAIRSNLLRFIKSAIVTGSDGLELQSEYEAIFGFSAVLGDFVQVRRVYLNQANGQIFDSGISIEEVIEV